MNNFRTRLIQVLFFFPCVILDGLALFIVLIPIWLLTGFPITDAEPSLQWLFTKLPKKLKK